jgi:hypothetical protein
VPRLERGANHWTLLATEKGAAVRHAWDEYPELCVSNATPYGGEEVAITATVYNRTAKAMRNVPVRFTQANTRAVLGKVMVPVIRTRGSAKATLRWKAKIIGDRPARAKGVPRCYVHSVIQAEVGPETEYGKWTGAAKTIVMIRPRPVPRFNDGLVWSSDARYANESKVILRAALVHLLSDEEGALVYVPDSSLSATLTPYIGRPDRGGFPLAPPKRLEKILPTEFGVAEWEISTVAMPEKFTAWVEALCDDPVEPDGRRLLAKRVIHTV